MFKPSLLEQLESRCMMSASLSIQSADTLPVPGRFAFNRIQNQNKSWGDTVHDTSTVRLINTGDEPLLINSVALSSPMWQMLNAPLAGTSIDVGSEYDFQLKFVATTAPSVPYNETTGKYGSNNGVWNGTLTVNSNDASSPIQSAALAGYFQRTSENTEEPTLATVVNLLYGSATNIANGHPQYLSQPSTMPTYYGDEVVSPYWTAVDPSQPVTIQQMDSFHGQGQVTTVSWFDIGASANPRVLWYTQFDGGQQLFPMAYGPTSTPIDSKASFLPAGAFGLKVDYETSDDTLNTTPGGGGHHMRFYPLRDGAGQIVPNTFWVAQDYGGSIANFDFQDNVFLITNVRPENRSAQPAMASATGVAGLGVSLQWATNTEANVIGYNVYRATTINGSYSKLNSTNLLSSPSFIDSTTKTGVVYYYRVTAINSYQVESLPTTVSATGPALATIAPATPTGIAVTSFSSNQIAISWNDVAGETGYKIERSNSAATGWKQIAITSADVTTFSDASVGGSTSYFYRVHSYNTKGTSGTIGYATATTTLGLPVGWSDVDLEATAEPGYSFTTGSTYTVDGSSQFAYTTWNGNGQAIARVLSGTLGIMFRDSLDPNSRAVTLRVSSDGVMTFSNRAVYEGNTALAATGDVPTNPTWIKVVRAGSWFTGLTSLDGIHWIVAATVNLPLNTFSFVGLSSSDGVAMADSFYAGKISTPTAPSMLAASALTSNSIGLSWTSAADDATWVKIERSTDGVHFSQIAQIDSMMNSYVDPSLVVGKRYTYRVKRSNAGIDSAYSNLSAVQL